MKQLVVYGTFFPVLPVLQLYCIGEFICVMLENVLCVLMLNKGGFLFRHNHTLPRH